MTPLSTPIANIKDRYDVVVVGSGYGGGVAASRLARAGRRVCLLERGREILPGDYPNSALTSAPEMQVDGSLGRAGSLTGLYDLRLNDDINVFLGCGLGGTSLVNANVSLRPDDRVFDDGRWPAALRRDVGAPLDRAFDLAAEMLKPVPYPDGQPALPKLKAMGKIGAAMAGAGAEFSRPPINVTFEEGVNHVGVRQEPCNGCGDCVTGCNFSAKNTVLMNYLPDARNHGAEIFTQAAVRRVEKRGGEWLVHYQFLNVGREKFDAPEMTVRAGLVVLAAGALGSSEILLRSKAAGLPLSDRLGRSFTGNGDVLAFGYNCDQDIRGIGFGARDPKRMEPVGPCITGLVDMRGTDNVADGMVIEEGSLPGGLAAFLPGAFAAGSKMIGMDTDGGLMDSMAERTRELASLVGGAYVGAMDNTLTFLVMSHDDGDGRMVLEDDRLRVHWPEVGAQPVFKTIEKRLVEATRAVGGTYLKNPMWTNILGQRLITVHPLGGCAMADDAGAGVVDGDCQVFAGSDGSDVHDGLYVLDGAIMARSLGVNPLFAITALAERGVARMAEARGWSIDYGLPSKPPKSAPRRLGIRFTETMRGYVSTAVKDDYEAAYAAGEAADSPFAFTLSVISDDLETMLTDENHAAKMVGSVTAPALSPDPLTATEATFNLFVRPPDEPDSRRMRYRMKLSATDGRSYYFEGFKRIKDDFGLDVWADTTTLYITVHDGEDDSAPVLGKGMLKIRPDDFARQITTMEVSNADSLAESIEAQMRFGRFFAGAIFDVYAPKL